MKVIIEDRQGHVIVHYNIISIVDYDKFLSLSSEQYMGKRIPKKSISSVEIIPG